MANNSGYYLPEIRWDYWKFLSGVFLMQELDTNLILLIVSCKYLANDFSKFAF